MVRRHIVDNDLEEKILTGLIISDKICRDTHRLIRKDTFQNPYTQTISKWVVNYYKKYGKAPRTQIQDIFNVESAKLKEGEEPLIASFLSRLSSELEKEENLNEDYLIDRAILYIKKRTLKNISEKIDSYLEMDKLEDAEMELQSYQQVERDSSKFINPFSDETITKFFEDHNNNANNMFRMPGALGDLIGDFERSTLVGIMGPAKRGKSFLLMEIAFQAFLERYKVLFVSLEMSQYKMERRILSRITAMGEEERDFVLPCFDCYRNQMNICNKSERTCHTRLRNDKGEKPTEFHPSSRYVVCTACRGTDDFFMDSWFTTIHKKKRTRTNSKNIAKGLLQMYDDNFRLICHPKFSANISRIKSDIEMLEAHEDWIPDVIVVDYADILAPEDSRVIGRDRYDDTWKMFGNLADTRKALVVTASQTNRQSFNKKNVTATDAAEDIRKIANVDIMLSLNQTADEKKEGVMRIAVVAGRDEDFNEYRTCVVLQTLELGQPYLDSEMSSTKEIQKLSDENED